MEQQEEPTPSEMKSNSLPPQALAVRDESSKAISSPYFIHDAWSRSHEYKQLPLVIITAFLLAFLITVSATLIILHFKSLTYLVFIVYYYSLLNH